MRKTKRRKVIKMAIEDRIEANQKRIQHFSEENFQLRRQLEELAKLPTQKPFVKAEAQAIAAEDRLRTSETQAEEATDAVH